MSDVKAPDAALAAHVWAAAVAASDRAVSTRAALLAAHRVVTMESYTGKYSFSHKENHSKIFYLRKPMQPITVSLRALEIFLTPTWL